MDRQYQNVIFLQGGCISLPLDCPVMMPIMAVIGRGV